MHAEPAPELYARALALPAVAAVRDRLGADPGVPVALVGGAVRDLLLGGTPPDVDVVVEGTLDRVLPRLGGQVRAHERFGTARLTLAGHSVDVASARRERYPFPGALPEVAPADLATDLARRDFTVNAIALRLAGPGAGELLAVEDARDDLAAGRLRVLHTASFVDDPTRLLRLARYAARLGFAAERRTLELAVAALDAGALGTVSGPRIGAELRLLAAEPEPVAAFAALRALGADRAIDPRFGLTDDGWGARALELLGPDGRRDRLVLALAVRRIGPEAAAALLDRLGFCAEDRDAVTAAAIAAVPLCKSLGRAERPSELAATIGRAPAEAVALAGALGPAEQARRWLGALRHIRPAIDGADLLAAGIPEGPAVGRGLAAARAAALDGADGDRPTQLAAALAAARGALPSGR